MKKRPKISIILPVYNGERFLKQTLKSILSQSFKDFELIIINDGSRDKTWKILNSFNDPRIKIITNTTNLGLVISLNNGFAKASGKYIARCDADDTNDPKRLEQQVRFLDSHPGYVLIGTNCEWVDGSTKLIKGFNVETTDNLIRKKMFIRNQFHHPSVMIRRQALRNIGAYRKLLNGVEDYDLWFRLMKIGKVANLEEKLIKRRVYKDSVSTKNHIKIEFLAIVVRIINLPLIRLLSIDIIVGIFIFLIYKFWLTYLLFKDRLIPPEPDDAYLYLYSAKRLFSIESFEQFRMLFFSIWLNIISFFTSSNLETAFKYNFYLGILILFPILIFFIRQMEKNKFNQLILIVMLGLYTGTGAYHGFYWVLPSFYMIGLLFLLLSFVFYAKKVNSFVLFFLTVFYIFIHPSSILFILIFPLITVASYLLKQNSQIRIRALIIFFSGLIWYLIYSLISKRYPSLGSMNSPDDTLNTFLNILHGKIEFLSWPIIWHEYFKFIFLNPITLIVFLICIGFCFYLKQFKLLMIYFSGLLILAISTINPFGYRALEFLWPVTFLILGYGLIGIKNVFDKINQKYSLLSVLSLLFVFAFIVNSLNLIWIRSLNTKDEYVWDKNCPQQLNYFTKSILFDSWESYYAFKLNNLDNQNTQVIMPDTKINNGDLLINKDRSQLKIYQPSVFESLLTTHLTRTEVYPVYQVPNYYWTNLGSKKLNNFKQQEIKSCGYFKIFELRENNS